MGLLERLNLGGNAHVTLAFLTLVTGCTANSDHGHGAKPYTIGAQQYHLDHILA